jgi:hypothetical protein
MGMQLVADGDRGPARPVTRWWPGSHRQRGISGEEDIMLVEHQHKPGVFDPGHCRVCAHEADLLDHYWRVQREERAFREAHRWARRAYRQAAWALWCSGIGIVLAIVALLAR